MAPNPRKERRLRTLDNQIRRLHSTLQRLERRSYRLSWLRLGVIFLGLMAAAIAYLIAGPWPFAACIAIAIPLFGLAVHAHRCIEASIRRHQSWLRIKTGHRARLALDWQRIPRTFPHQPRPNHPFEADLDIVGLRSLLQLLDTAVSLQGSTRLRSWLAAPLPNPQSALQRQQLVRELAPRSLFRDRLTMNATLAVRAGKTSQAENLVHWLDAHTPRSPLRPWLLLLGGLALLNLVLLVANLAGYLPALWQISVALYLGLLFIKSRDTRTVWDEALALEAALRQSFAIFRHLERFSYEGAPHLRTLCQPFLDRDCRPSHYLARINRIVAAMGVRGNPLVWLAFNALLPWDFIFADRLNAAKAAMAAQAPAWLDVWFELEALGSLANFAHANPGCVFPTFLESNGGVASHVLRAQSLGHPLIPDRDRVCNNLTVQTLGQVSTITGSNMSGKTVFLKTLGVNLALANAGGPVCATRLETLPFRLFTSMRVSDSVTDGISYFYAEVQRLKTLLQELQRDDAAPLLYCIDEIFRGTNNRERLIGSRAYIRTLSGKHGLGFVATHDLELTRLSDEVPGVMNYHFRDAIDGGRMVFDYLLHPGPSPTTNALTIMRLEGLPVDY
jgi:hypothetical protein